MDGLHHEIIDFCQWIAPSPHEFDVRWYVFNRTREIILRLYAQRQEQCTVSHLTHYTFSFTECIAQVQYYGSFRTALFLPTSDLDLVILTPEQWRHKVPMDELAKELIDSGITTEKHLKVGVLICYNSLRASNTENTKGLCTDNQIRRPQHRHSCGYQLESEQWTQRGRNCRGVLTKSRHVAS